MPLTEVKLRPITPWRTGYRGGDKERVDEVYHSDSLYSALTHAMRALGWMEEWLEADVRLSSLFPYQGERRAMPGEPAVGLRSSVRSGAAVDRLTGVAEPHRSACLEFAPDAGWWGVFDSSDPWDARMRSAFRLLADSGFGGERSRGWGRAAEPAFTDAAPLFEGPAEPNAWRLLSLYSPDAEDSVDWPRSSFTHVVRGGWTDSAAGVASKKQVRMIEEGSVLRAASIKGRRVNVAPDGFAHPVWRWGVALAIPVRVDE